MKIVKIEDLHANGGYSRHSFLKITTDEGIVGWSQYPDHGDARAGVTGVIRGFAERLTGLDPREVGRISMTLHSSTFHAMGGLNHLAIAAIENALLDIQGKALGVPVYALFGGPFRRDIDLYWTHCGSFRVARADFYEKELGLPPIRTLDDLSCLAREAVELGFKAVKTNPVILERGRLSMFNGGWRLEPGKLFTDRNPERAFINGIVEQLEAFRAGLGPDAGLMIDLAFNQRTEGFRRIAKALEPLDLTWLEIESKDPQSLAFIRSTTSTPIASLETLYGQREFLPFFQNYAVDVAIIDANYNGVWQAARIAALADAHELNVAPHNPLPGLASLQSAHFCASIPNFRIMEYRWDEAPWVADFLTHPIIVEKGRLILSDRPGWGSDIDEAVLAAHPAI
ncbi:mandelate racemase/muconate lactonizing enzyme family protein [Telmatospirillum siberiense]|uniref:Mandelate racemase/muconate lactonizing enzyme family protein n=1 Tax=Telmatospirillum siberiense TaxID=382514 RepID=A0A2N3PQ35_9PROT|nr:mandelate racemase/muconate lactonizing enzyme family protein [Telmatospirillum siberiense]PKU22509.1 mandelate racemase/muconate lactonizing enzyme family protein [Telmatospirillum siberiense]